MHMSAPSDLLAHLRDRLELVRHELDYEPLAEANSVSAKETLCERSHPNGTGPVARACTRTQDLGHLTDLPEPRLQATLERDA
jgi:hypothetical protein